MKRKNVALGGLMLLLTATSVTGLGGWYSAHRQIGELQAQLTELERQEKRSVVLRSVSQQMEVIALQQKDISDEQREEAIQQTRVDSTHRQPSTPPSSQRRKPSKPSPRLSPNGSLPSISGYRQRWPSVRPTP